MSPLANLVAVCCLVGAAATTVDARPAARATHVRLTTAHGPVHVWTPAGYDRTTAGIVVYVHGFYTDVDTAWRAHKLAAQFAESGLDAMFIACEAPRGGDSSVSWVDLDELLAAVGDELEDPLPDGPLIAVGHSGAHRTLTQWLGNERLATVVLVDALYGEVDEFRTWLDDDEGHRLIDAAAVTRPWSEQLVRAIPDALVFDRFPPPREGKLEGARKARVVYVRSQHDHMSLVTDGIALPMLLRALRLPLVPTAARNAAIRTRR